MIISCPECASEFDIPLGLLGYGRNVRCANCRMLWFAEGIVAPKPPPSPYAASKTAISDTGYEIRFDLFRNQGGSIDDDDAPAKPTFFKYRLAEERAKMFMQKITYMRSAGVAAAIVIALCWMFISAAPSVGHAHQVLTEIYEGLGVELTSVGEGLGIDRLVIRSIWLDNGNSVEIKSKITNLADKKMPLPALKIEVVDSKGKPAGQAWRFDLQTKELGIEESVPFTVKLPAMPRVKGDVLTLKASFIAKH